jgi:putative phosphoesterase
MKTAVFADIHANIQALEAVLRDCEIQGIDKFWLLGDYVDYGAEAFRVIQVLMSLNAEHIISGNHDACLFNNSVRNSNTPHGKLSYLYTKNLAEAAVGKFEWLRNISHIPQKLILNKRILLVHGTPRDPYWGKFTPDCNSEILFEYMSANNIEIMFMGHSHISFKLTKGGMSIINPGSVGQPRNGNPSAQYAIFENDTVIFRSIKYDIEAAAQDIYRAGLPEYLAQRLFKGV